MFHTSALVSEGSVSVKPSRRKLQGCGLRWRDFGATTPEIRMGRQMPVTADKTPGNGKAEICSLLAAALLRLRSAQSSKLRSDFENTGLPSDAQQSGYDADQMKDLLP